MEQKKVLLLGATFGIGATVVYIIIKNRKLSYLRNYGYDGPKPSLIKLGNLVEFNSKSNSSDKSEAITHYSKTLYRWTQEYGKIYGYYESTSPVLVLADADLVKDVFLKREQYRRVFTMSKKSDAPDANVFINNGERWKRVRKVLEKVFLNVNNLQRCLNYFDNSFATVFHNINMRESTKPDLFYCIRATVAHTVFQTMFGMKLNEFNDLKSDNQGKTLLNTDFNDDFFETKAATLNNKLTKHLVDSFMKAFNNFESPSFLKIASMACGELELFWKVIVWFKTIMFNYFRISYFADPMEWFTANYLQPNYEIHSSKIIQPKFCFFKELLDKEYMRSLSLDEIKSNTLLMFFAGFETTSTAIAFAIHVLKTNKEELSRLKNEIKEVLAHDNTNEISYSSIDELKYLDLFIKEVLRMYPIANSMVSRQCNEDDLCIGDNKQYFIPKGINIVVDVLSIHYDASLWGPVDPNVFYPNRFLEKRHPAAWLPFGIFSNQILKIHFT